jgi:hypothetical protein
MSYFGLSFYSPSGFRFIVILDHYLLSDRVPVNIKDRATSDWRARYD